MKTPLDHAPDAAPEATLQAESTRMEVAVANRLGIIETEVHEGTKVYDAATRDELLWYYAHVTTKGLSLSEAANAVKTDRTVLSRVWRGNYVNQRGDRVDPKKLVSSIRLVRTNEEMRLGRVSVGFVETETATRILETVDAARRDRAIVVIHGPSHVGKTTALREIVRVRQGVFYVRTPVDGNLRGLVRAVATAIGIDPSAYTHAALKATIAARLNDTHQLIIDEAHDIIVTYRREDRIKSCEWLRELYDDGRGPSVILCGTPVLNESIERGPLATLLEQFAMRTLAPLNLKEAPSPADVEAIIKAYGFPKAKGEDRKFIAGVVATKRLKGLTYRLSRALAYAAEDKDKGNGDGSVTWEHFRESDAKIGSFATGRIYDESA